MTDTIYRGYEIRKGTSGYWIYRDIQQVSETAFPTEEKACDEIDRWKREAAARKVA